MTHPSRARGIVVASPTVLERVTHIADLMRADAWRTSMTRELAAHWGVSTDSVEKHATEASRMVKGLLDPQAARDKVNDLFEKAERALEGVDNPKDYVSLVHAHLDRVARLAGLGAKSEPTRVVVSREVDEYAFEPRAPALAPGQPDGNDDD